VRKLIIAATVAASIAVPALAAVPAMADNGHTGTTLELTTTWQGYTYVHDYTLTTVGSPSDHAFKGVSTDNNPAGVRETVTGTLKGQTITINGEYTGTNYSWSYSGPLSGGTATDSYNDQAVNVAFTTSN
jgi:hypothetical protein